MRKLAWSTAAVIAAVVPVAGAMVTAVRPSHAEGNTVTVDDSDRDPQQWKFVPAEITVAPGSTVTWSINGQHAHTVNAQDGSFSSGYISPGTSWQHTFDTAGDYAYFCEPHPWKKGVVHVK